MSYQRRYLQQTQARAYSPKTTSTTTFSQRSFDKKFSVSLPHQDDPDEAAWAQARINLAKYRADQEAWKKSITNQYGDLAKIYDMGSGPVGNGIGEQRTYRVWVNEPNVTNYTSYSSTTGRLRRGEMAGGDLRLNMAQGKRSLRIEPTELGQLPGRDLPPPGADSYDPFSASEAESLAGLRRRRGPQSELAINASNAATGLNTL